MFSWLPTAYKTLNRQFFFAIKRKDIDTVRELLPHIDVNYKHECGHSLLHFHQCKSSNISIACASGSHEIVKLLLDHPNIRLSPRTQKQLMIMGYIKSDLGLMEILLKDARIDPNVKILIGDRKSLFYCICELGWADMARLFMKFPRVDVTTRTVANTNALHAACKNGHTEVVWLLLNDPRIVIDWYILPMLCAIGGKYEIIKMLIQDRRVNVNCKDRNDKRPIEIAMITLNIQLLRLFLSGIRSDLRVPDVMQWPLTIPADPHARTIRLEQALELRRDFGIYREATQRRLMLELGITDEWICKLFWLTECVANETHTVISNCATGKFFKLVKWLPTELRMLICNRVYGKPDICVPILKHHLYFGNI